MRLGVRGSQIAVARTGPRPAAILALVCAAAFMGVLDIAIVNVALPSIQHDLALPQSSLQWVVIAYGLMFGGFLLLGGRLADLLGRRRILVTGLTVFALASLGSGLAPSLAILVVSRGVQGLGAALTAPSALSILTTTFAEGEGRNRALGVWGAVAGSGATAGVIAGGVLTSGPGWQWIFFINVPIGLGLAALALLIVPEGRRGNRARRFDAAGATTATAGLLLLVYAVSRSIDDGWVSPWTVIPLVAGAVLMGAFILVELRSRSPLVPGVPLGVPGRGRRRHPGSPHCAPDASASVGRRQARSSPPRALTGATAAGASIAASARDAWSSRGLRAPAPMWLTAVRGARRKSLPMRCRELRLITAGQPTSTRETNTAGIAATRLLPGCHGAIGAGGSGPQPSR